MKDLSTEQKSAIESLLGRRVSDDESVSIKASGSEILRSQLTGEERKAALEKVNRYFARVDARRQSFSDEEENAILEEALRSVRPSYRPIG